VTKEPQKAYYHQKKMYKEERSLAPRTRKRPRETPLEALFEVIVAAESVYAGSEEWTKGGGQTKTESCNSISAPGARCLRPPSNVDGPRNEDEIP
jgi:hypothetical protein